MANFFLDNKDLQFHLQHPLMRKIVELKERGFAEKDLYDYAPQDFEDAMDSYRRVLDREGRVLLENRVGGEVCLRRETAALVTSMLEEVVRRGTASALTLPESGVAVAGKTGTTQNTCDRWFVGYTPRLLCGVWMGYDYPASLEDLGGNPCLGIFDAVMKRAEQVYRGAPAQREFTLLGDLIRVSYCRTTGLLPCPGCREDGKMAEGWFLRGTEPRTVCDCHGRKVGDPEPPDEIK